MLVTLCWLTEEWDDQNLAWNPSLFDDLTEIRVPHDELWEPDTYLYNK